MACSQYHSDSPLKSEEGGIGRKPRPQTRFNFTWWLISSSHSAPSDSLRSCHGRWAPIDNRWESVRGTGCLEVPVPACPSHTVNYSVFPCFCCCSGNKCLDTVWAAGVCKLHPLVWDVASFERNFVRLSLCGMWITWSQAPWWMQGMPAFAGLIQRGGERREEGLWWEIMCLSGKGLALDKYRIPSGSNLWICRASSLMLCGPHCDLIDICVRVRMRSCLFCGLARNLSNFDFISLGKTEAEEFVVNSSLCTM